VAELDDLLEETTLNDLLELTTLDDLLEETTLRDVKVQFWKRWHASFPTPW
jgi:hypothetical protein